jgi:hypothetical protein
VSIGGRRKDWILPAIGMACFWCAGCDAPANSARQAGSATNVVVSGKGTLPSVVQAAPVVPVAPPKEIPRENAVPPASPALAQAPAMPSPASAAPGAASDSAPAESRRNEALEENSEPQRIYRPSDDRPHHDAERAAALGIQQYQSRRLLLYTDIDPEIAQTLPPIIDQAYDAWVDYFGELAPNREGTDFQVTGYLIGDSRRFVEAGMLPDGPPMFRFGRHIGMQFWMNNQNSDYYRRHLLIHEATHCYTTIMPGLLPPLWYLEGIAEYFGTHLLDPQGHVTFGVMPLISEDFPGLGRIELIQQMRLTGPIANLAEIGVLNLADFRNPRPDPYAWSWALCKFLDAHPRYQDRFRRLARHLEGGAFQRLLDESFAPDRILLSCEWHEFAQRLDYGFDIAANAFVPRDCALLEKSQRKSVDVDAAPGWQCSGIEIPAGSTIKLAAEGQVTLDTLPRPWISEPQGISIRYSAGKPIGTLLGGLMPVEAPAGAQPQLQVFVVGRGTEIKVPRASTLWLRVNDAGDDLWNNTGSYQVTIQRP